VKAVSTKDSAKTRLEALQAENSQLRLRLEEAEETLSAIRSGGIDAVVVEQAGQNQIYTLAGADRPYRLFVEEMHQGAATLQADGTIAWCNRQLGLLLKLPQTNLMGMSLRGFVRPEDQPIYDHLLREGKAQSARAEAQLRRADGALVPAFLTFNALPEDCGSAIGVLVTDLTPERRHEELSANHTALRASEDRLRRAHQVARIGTFEWNIQTGQSTWDEDLEAMYGLSPGGFASTQAAWEQLIHPDDRAETLRRVSHALASGKFEGEWRTVWPDGSTHWLAGRAIVLRDESGKPLKLFGVNIDVTESKQKEEALLRAERELREFLENASVAMHWAGPDGRIIWANQTELNLLGYTREEYIGHHLSEFHLEQPILEDILGRLSRGDTLQDYAARLCCKDGSVRDVLINSNVLWEDGRFMHTRCFTRDITERKQTEEALRAAQAQLEEHARQLETRVAERTSDLQAINQQLEAFVYSIAHDLRAPLRSMQGFSELLLESAKTALNEQGRDLARRISTSAQFMDALLQDLLAFSRVAQQSIELTPVRLQTVVRSVIVRLEKEIGDKTAQVELVEPLAAVYAHEPTLGQVLYNLISNGLKFVAPGVVPHVRIRGEDRPAQGPAPADANGKFVRVWVEDNGIGIAPEHHQQIFRLFTRLQGSAYGGTGVGLAIVQKGVERMGGGVGVESSTGRGSRFWFDLRRA